MFIVFEGHDGSGKSTQAKLFADYLRSKGKDVVEVRSPGGSGHAEALRKLSLQQIDGEDASTYGRHFMMQAAFAETWFKVIKPALKAGKWVVADRWFMSSYLYQVVGEGLPLDFWRDSNFVEGYRKVVGVTEISPSPDSTIRLLVAEDVRLKRKAKRDGDMVLDSMERQGSDFENRIAEALEDSFPWNLWCNGLITVRQEDEISIEDVHKKIVESFEGNLGVDA